MLLVMEVDSDMRSVPIMRYACTVPIYPVQGQRLCSLT